MCFEHAVEIGDGEAGDVDVGVNDADAIEAEPNGIGGVEGGVIVQINGAHGAEIFDAAEFELGVVPKDYGHASAS
jgi:hypothetical protein